LIQGKNFKPVAVNGCEQLHRVQMNHSRLFVLKRIPLIPRRLSNASRENFGQKP